MKEICIKTESYETVSGEKYEIFLYMNLKRNDDFFFTIKEYKHTSKDVELVYEDEFGKNIEWAIDMVHNIIMGHSYDDKIELTKKGLLNI